MLSAEDIKAGEHALAGRYVGGKVSASWGGIGAAALVGGSNDNFALNPWPSKATRVWCGGGYRLFVYRESALGITFGAQIQAFCVGGPLIKGASNWQRCCRLSPLDNHLRLQ